MAISSSGSEKLILIPNDLTLDHIRRVLGEPREVLPVDGFPDLAIVHARNPSLEGTSCFMTAGISALDQIGFEGSAQPADVEYAVIGRLRTVSAEMLAVGILTALAQNTIETRQAVYPYSVVSLASAEDSKFTSALIVNGSPLPAALGDVASDLQFIVLWAIPITNAEANYARLRSVHRLMLLLRWSGTDIFDFGRGDVCVPPGIDIARFRTSLGSGQDVGEAVLRLLEGEVGRTEVVGALASLLHTADDGIQQLAIEALEALALSEPEAFAQRQTDDIESTLSRILEAEDHPMQTFDALAAVRHARVHART